MGSNLGDRAALLEAAAAAIASLPLTSPLARSRTIETQPVGPPGQGPYLNAVILVSTALPPRELLDQLLGIERAHGRQRGPGQRWGPRTLDLDLLLYGDRTIDEPGLEVPHPRLHERAFVLIPLAEVASGWPVPGAGATVGRLLERLEARG